MKTLLILLSLMTVTAFGQLDVTLPIGLPDGEGGYTMLYANGSPHKLGRTTTVKGAHLPASVVLSAYPNAVNVTESFVSVTNTIDRTLYEDVVDDLGVTNNVPVDARYWKEAEFVGHVYQAGLKVKPDATLEEVITEAKKDFAGRKAKLAIERDASDRGNSSRQAEINEGVEESMELRLEAFMLGYDLFDPDFAQPTKAVITRERVLTKIEE